MVIILSHSIVPHSHHKSPGEFISHIKEANQNQNFFEWFKAIFHQDLGHEHLENYNPSDSESTDFNGFYTFVAFAYVQWNLETETDEEQITLPFQSVFHDILHPDTDPLRGPPSLS